MRFCAVASNNMSSFVASWCMSAVISDVKPPSSALISAFAVCFAVLAVFYTTCNPIHTIVASNTVTVCSFPNASAREAGRRGSFATAGAQIYCGAQQRRDNVEP
jgi:hypothetical protein